MMRQFHRWFSFPLILFLLLVTATGVVLQGEEVSHLGGGERRPTPTTSALPDDAVMTAQLGKALAAARQANPELATQTVTLNYGQAEPSAKFSVAPRGGPSVDVNLATGVAKVAAAPPPSLHVWMIRLHTGQYFGPVGVIILMAAALIMLFLAVSGGVLYWQMWQNRRGRGKGQLFWK